MLPRGGPGGNSSSQPIVTKRVMVSYGAAAVTAAATTSLTVAAGSVTSSLSWADYAALFQEFRVTAMRVTVIPRWWAPAGGTSGNSATIGCAFGAGTLSGAAAVLSAPGRRMAAHVDKIVIEVDHRMNPNAKLFTSVGTALPSANSIGVLITQLAANTTTSNWDYVVEYETEFRGQY